MHRLQYNSGPVVTDNVDNLGSYNVAFSLNVEGVTSKQIGKIIMGQWPNTSVWQGQNPGYNYFIVGAQC